MIIYDLIHNNFGIDMKLVLDKLKQEITSFKKENPNKNFNREIRGDFDYTPLHMAVLRNDFKIVKLLIEEGADPTIRILKSVYKPNGILALYLAEKFEKKDISNILKPYTEKYYLENSYYNSILHSNIIKNKRKLLAIKLQDIYFKIHPFIMNIELIRNKIDFEYLPNEIWIKILEFCELKDFKILV
jgi:ankyrin repeat protein